MITINGFSENPSLPSNSKELWGFRVIGGSNTLERDDDQYLPFRNFEDAGVGVVTIDMVMCEEGEPYLENLKLVYDYDSKKLKYGSLCYNRAGSYEVKKLAGNITLSTDVDGGDIPFHYGGTSLLIKNYIGVDGDYNIKSVTEGGSAIYNYKYDYYTGKNFL